MTNINLGTLHFLSIFRWVAPSKLCYPSLSSKEQRQAIWHNQTSINFKTFIVTFFIIHILLVCF